MDTETKLLEICLEMMDQRSFDYNADYEICSDRFKLDTESVPAGDQHLERCLSFMDEKAFKDDSDYIIW